MDIYATNNSVNSGYSLMSDTSCGLTDANWTTCTDVTKPQLKFYPINSCGSINYSGNYTLSQSILADVPDCIKIDSSNVKLSCDSYRVSEQNDGTGIGIYVNTVKNVSISNCIVNNAKYAYYIADSNDITINSSSSSGGNFGIYVLNSKGITLYNSSNDGLSNSGVYLNSTANSSISFGTMSADGSGIYLYNSSRNAITKNNGTSDTIGIYINTNSTNNTVSQNSFTGSSTNDYECSGSSSGVSSEIGGINYGEKVSNCRWIAAVALNSGPMACSDVFDPSAINIATDSYYGFGDICEGIYANSTTINCNYNTITATDGGTFANFANVKNGVIEDCVLRGFSTAITIKNSSVTARNDIIYLNSTNSSNPKDSYGIGIYSSKDFKVNNVTIISNSTGLLVENSAYGEILDNNVSAADIGYYVDNVSGTEFKGNIGNSAGFGLTMQNSTSDTFEGNLFNATVGGVFCTGTSKPSNADSNSGLNYCSTNSGCLWLSNSNC